MWIFLPESSLSIVQKPNDVDTLTVRARVKGDIERVFPDAEVIEGAGTDYRYRARIDRELVAQAMYNAVMSLNWPNFKGAVRDGERRAAYMDCWSAMLHYQRQTASRGRQ